MAKDGVPRHHLQGASGNVQPAAQACPSSWAGSSEQSSPASQQLIEAGLLYERLYPSLLRYACLKCRNEADAADLVQKIFVDLLERGEVCAVEFEKVIWTAIRCRVIDLIRYRVREHEILEQLASDRVGNQVVDGFAELEPMFAEVREALDLLPGRLAEVIWLRHICHKSDAQIATIINRDRITVFKMRKKAYAKLKTILGNWCPLNPTNRHAEGKP